MLKSKPVNKQSHQRAKYHHQLMSQNERDQTIKELWLMNNHNNSETDAECDNDVLSTNTGIYKEDYNENDIVLVRYWQEILRRQNFEQRKR